jgi:hypothetical protein
MTDFGNGLRYRSLVIERRKPSFGSGKIFMTAQDITDTYFRITTKKKKQV